MTSGPIATPYRRIPVSIVALLLAAAFAVGALTGLGVPRLLNAAPTNAGAAPQTVPAAVNSNSGDWTVRVQFAPPYSGQGTSVAENNMGEATSAAQFAGK
jgi:hypothetical protein